MFSTSGLVRPGLVLLDSTLGGDGQSHWFQCLRVLDTGGGSSTVLESRRRNPYNPEDNRGGEGKKWRRHVKEFSMYEQPNFI